ncbi:hypothetical protein BDY19DRAFT_907966 [Irpex rosettiformis]|uniref:Uncharacterized protein n=1 Tax=Irpex rosettiformis TaxID=378272 RepID=A0ACB8TXQ2_9APHY|nr:hypothetical protein BDY19DRAFT_907966 [Irpex rosettiformis]
MFKSLLALSVLALGVAASPIKRETGPWCDGWWAGYDVASGFTLTAYNLSDASDPNAVGYPLVLGQAGAIDGAAFHVLSTYESYPYGNPNQTWALNKGTLLPEDQTSTKYQGAAVNPGDEPSWMSSNEVGPSAQIWCGIPQTSPHGGGRGNPSITVNSDIDKFSLCKQWDAPDAQVNIVYKASPNNTGYIYDSCFGVEIEIVNSF